MAMQQMSVTMTGFAASHPTRHGSVARLVTFRMASTPRWNDNGEWKDSGTLFIDVQCWGRLADNVMSAVVKGAPLVITGRMSSYTFTPENGGRTGADGTTYKETIWRVAATNVGLDLSHSPSTWSLRDRVKDAAPGGGPGDRGGTPPGEDVGGYASLPPVDDGPPGTPGVADTVSTSGAPGAPGPGADDPADGVPDPVEGPVDGELASTGHRTPF